MPHWLNVVVAIAIYAAFLLGFGIWAGKMIAKAGRRDLE